jgi:CHAT domain-containing protein
MQRLNDVKGIVLAGQRVQNLLQEAEIRVDESHPDKLAKEDSIGDLEERERLLRESLAALAEVWRGLEDHICQRLLKELYQALIAPVEAALEGAEELLIVPHKELFEVPWAALTDADGRYLIERHVIRIAPSLRVARQLADKMQEHGSEKAGHAVVVGNPWPNSSGRLEYAEREAQSVARMLREKRFQVDLHVTIDATKRRVGHNLKGVGWAHFSCHADKDTQSLLLATPHVRRMGADEWARMKNLSMKDVETEVKMGVGSTAVLSACNTGRGEIKAEGVVGLARGFLSAGAAATVVSLWSVDDGSTASLMEHMYTQIAQGNTVPQALRSSMLRLARCNPADGLPEEWKRPYHWAGFVVVGATTRLPLL